MRNPAPPIVSHTLAFIDDLLHNVEQGLLRVPRFQRGFVWKPAQVLDLLESVNKGYPIGSLVLWSTEADVPSVDHVGPLHVPPPPQHGITNYLIDGQQRISVLYGTLRLPADFPNDREESHWQWWAYYDLRTRLFKHAPGGQRAPTDMPVRCLLRTRDFLKEARQLAEQFSEEEALPLIEEAESLAQRFRAYKVPAMYVREDSLDEAVAIFTRLNTKGKILSKEDLVASRIRAEGERTLSTSRRGRRRT